MNSPNMRLSQFALLGAVVAFVLGATSAHAQAKKQNPASKIYISDVSGEAQIATADFTEDLSRRSVYSAQGSVIDTKRPTSPQDRGKYYSTMVYSNGTGAFFDADTRVEIKKFVQEPFLPNRSDMEVEPSISETQAHVVRGTVGLCTSKLVAGSSMTYSTPLGSINVSGRKLVIQSEPGVTRFSMIEGDSTVRSGTMDMGGHSIHTGEQAIIRPGAAGQPNQMQIVRIPENELSQLEDKVTMACMAKRTVYFDTRTRQQSNGDSTAGGINAFNTGSGSRTAGSPFTDAEGEIIALPVLPSTPPVQFTVSPATLTTPSGNVITPGNGTPTPGQGNGR